MSATETRAHRAAAPAGGHAGPWRLVRTWSLAGEGEWAALATLPADPGTDDPPLAIVTAVAGVVQADLEITGRSGLASSPVAARADAALVAARAILAAPREARRRPGGIATVGELELWPGRVDVVPGRARLSLDVRAPDDRDRDAVLEAVVERARSSARAHGATVELHVRARRAAVPFDPTLSSQVTAAGEDLGVPLGFVTLAPGDDAALPDGPGFLLAVPGEEGAPVAPETLHVIARLIARVTQRHGERGTDR